MDRAMKRGASNSSNHVVRSPGWPPHNPGTERAHGSSQFFINTVHYAFLLPRASKHPVFSKVTQGMDVVNKIGKTPTSSGDRPSTPVFSARENRPGSACENGPTP
jgi:hypothetical protein